MKNKIIYSICTQCSTQLYPKKLFSKDSFNGITVYKTPCSICGVKRMCIPIRDFWYELTKDIKYWD
jgi:hypothetical protein